MSLSSRADVVLRVGMLEGCDMGDGNGSGNGVSCLLDLNVDDSVYFDESDTGDEIIGVDVGQRGLQAEVAIRAGSGLVALAHAVRAVHEPAPPRVHRVQTLTAALKLHLKLTSLVS